MKFKNTLIIGLATLTLISCNDFLDVDSPSSYNEDFVFSQETEISRALNGVYASILVGDLYGSAYQKTFNLNSDVDMQMYTGNVATHNSYARFDCDDQGGEIDKYWRASYKAIEDANRFIRGVETGPLYNEENTAVMQMLGEAKCLRAMVYHDLVVMFGDVPFTFLPASQLGDNYVIPVMNREEIQNKLIEDLQDIAPKMSSSTTTTVERASKEFAWALIARIALTAGGYSLHPDKNNANSYGVMKRPEDYQKYYQIVKEYTSLVIASGTHSVGTSYQDIFTKESNFEIIAKGDPIFEIPFAKESTGNTGYSQGPTSTVNEGKTLGKNVWGESKGDIRLSAFYRYSFDENDKRRDFINGLWYYGNSANNATQDSCMIRADYTVHNNKWSKLWDLVRNNLYGQEIVYSFLRYLSVGMSNAGSSTGFEDDIAEHDGSAYLDDLPESMYYHVLPQTVEWRVDVNQVYGYPYPNKILDMLYIYNPYKSANQPATALVAVDGATWKMAEFYQWSNDSEPTNQCKYSFYGYIRHTEQGMIVLVKDGTESPLDGNSVPEVNDLPPVRYILPYPNAAIQRSAGVYKNYYGYK